MNDTGYEIDFDKVTSIDDLKRILKAFNITVWSSNSEFDNIKDLLRKIPEKISVI